MLAVLLLNRMNIMANRHRTERREKLENSCKLASEANEDGYCRTCLGTKDLSPIFNEKQTEEKRTRELKVTTGLQIKKNDGLSQRICSGCLDSLNQALKFRRKSKKTEKTLLNRISGNKTKKKYTKISKALKRPKIKKLEEDIPDYEYSAFEDSFQDEQDYKQDDQNFVDIKEEKIEIKPKVSRARRPRPRPTCPAPASYKCPTCSKEFRMKATYKAHMRFHTNYCVCESCGKRCRNNNQLQEHKRARHGLGRIHKCAYCEYSSATKEALTIHERRHTGERPYVCDHCGATFHRRSNLVQHIAIHLPEKNFQCDMCPKRLKSKKFLQIHKHNAHTGKRYGYLCPICEHRFEKPNKVRAHTRRVHGLPDDQQGPVVRVQL
ncbi:zinc finger protein 37 homolog [Bombyx mandarina]|uniref:Zinc finger protein 37 homolog n=1 Tax=Bombyx mandarina TaxID=7092 RepID=A0A6J2K9D5_BOMMA|nr:zinc finger protein 37 homolog [Bombyx mandarina]